MRKGNFARKNKAQASMIFVYITAIIIFAVVMLFGYKAINSFIDKGENTAFITFKVDLEKAVRNIQTDYGSVIVYDENNRLAVPGKYKKICFVDLERSPISNRASIMEEMGAIGYDIWETANQNKANSEFGAWGVADANVFLVPSSEINIKVGPLKVDSSDGFLCFGVDNYLKIRLEGRGSHTFVSKP